MYRLFNTDEAEPAGDAAHISQVQQVEAIVKTLSDRVKESQPDFSAILDKEIRSGIGSRRKSPSWGA